MILHRLYAIGFGPLAGEVSFDTRRLNLIVGPNESGKSTLAAAVAAALYGLEEDRRGYRGRFTPREQYEPWDGKTFAVELVFEVKGKRYTVNRNFGRETVSVHLEGKGDVTEEFRFGSGEYQVGEMLLGVNLDQFARSAFWLQPGPGKISGVGLGPDDSLSAMLERQASAVSGDASAQGALEVLDAAIRQYAVGDTRIQVSTQIRRLESSIEERRKQLAEEESRIERAGMALGELKKAREQEHELEKERRRSVATTNRLDFDEKTSLLRRDDEARAAVEKLRQEAAELTAVPVIEADAADRLRRAQAELEAAERSLKDLDRRRQEAYEKPLAELETERKAHEAFDWAMPVHLEELEEFARDYKRILDGKERSAGKQEEVEAELARAGISVERLQEQRGRFARLSAMDTDLLTHYPASAQAMATDREAAESVAETSMTAIDEIGSERRGRRALGGALLVIGLLAAAVSVWFALQGDVPLSFVGLAVTLLALVGGGIVLIRGATHRAAESNTALRALTDARRRLQQLKEQSAERELALNELTRRLGFGSNLELLREHAEYLQVVREGDRFAWVKEDLERLAGDESELRKRCIQWMEKVGAAGDPSTNPDDLDFENTIETLRKGVNRMLSLRSRYERLGEQARDFAEQERAARERKEKAIATARTVVDELGTPEGDWMRALEELERRRQAQERRQQITRTLPDLERHVLTDEARRSIESEIERLETELSRDRREHPGWFPPQSELEVTRTEAEDRLRQVQVALEEARERRFSLEKEIGNLEEETEGGGRASRLRLEIAELEREASRAERFRNAVLLAKERLQTVARETHALWSEYLSRRVNDLLPILGPNYRGFEVTDTLDFSLEIEGQRLDRLHLDQVLSAGAKDQLALALRIAVCEFLSRGGESLPLLLDDPFSSGDDERAAAGLRFLSEAISPTHQVIVMTCHMERVCAFREENAAWFEDHIQQISTPIGN